VTYLDFVKGHGTENDFVLLPDPDDRLELSGDLVRAVCDRRAGIGADGVLRVVGIDGGWFMDYRNADGSIAEMCGNGARVFGRYLVDAGLAQAGELVIGTRAGPRTLAVPAVGEITVDMGRPELLAGTHTVTGTGGIGRRTGAAVSMGNPHIVVMLADEAELAGLDLSGAPTVEPGLPDGQNVEFVVRAGDRALSLRVHERGVGETRSCGTGVCAAAVATIAAAGQGRGEDWSVRVPGGMLTVRWADSVLLTGPAVLVARGRLSTDGDRLLLGADQA
jgi:diaminopimelate epimerase